MAKAQNTTFGFTGRIAGHGITLYRRRGKVYARISTREVSDRQSMNQFKTREKMRHSIALWKALSHCSPMFTEGKTNYHSFLSLANKLPVVYMPKNKWEVEGSLLMPGIPVSGGTLRTMQQTLGEVDGIPALITDEEASNSLTYSAFLLYTAEQGTGRDDCPEVKFKVRAVQPDEFTFVDGCLALVDSDFANEAKGWALVRLQGKNCSSQGIVTRCKVYEQYTTEEALQTAAKSYGGLK